MNPEQIPQLLKQVSYADPRILPEDRQELQGLAALWAGVLADVPAEFAMWAVGQHYAESPFPIKPSDIAGRWRAHVRDRMNRHTGTLEPTRYPELDPDDVAGFMRTLRTERHAVIMGQAEPIPSKAITGTDAVPADVQERLDAIGQYIPDHVRQQMAAYRPQKAERERAIRAGQPDPLSVSCPWCDAAIGKPCRGRRTAPGRDPESKRQGTRAPHPSRTDAARTAA
ncbi:zinc finger domain-containing protein [Streptomyces sp. NPDC054849]